jgi:phosphate starvation-inducible PhoH-like protein
MSQQSGLRRSIDLLDHLDGIETVYLTPEDVVRHRLVKEIIKAYQDMDEKNRARKLREQEEKEAKEQEGK